MIIHQANSRGMADHGWLNSHHTFSFANYFEASRMGFGKLRVLNDDVVAAGRGFGTHPHRDMEIISIPLEGSLKHSDSEGNEQLIKKGDVQIMSAGTGVSHSEFNYSQVDAVSFLQIWVEPKKMGIKPRYEQKTYVLKKNEWSLLVSPELKPESVWINQDAFFSITKLEAGHIKYSKYIKSNLVYVFILNGTLNIQGKEFRQRDGIGLEEGEDNVEFSSTLSSEILVMEVPR